MAAISPLPVVGRGMILEILELLDHHPEMKPDILILLHFEVRGEIIPKMLIVIDTSTIDHQCCQNGTVEIVVEMIS